MTSTPMLALPDLNEPFIVETNASHKALGVVLMQAGRPIVFLSQTLGPSNQVLSIYEKDYNGDESAKELLVSLSLQPDTQPGYTYSQGVIKYKGRLYIRSANELRSKLIACMHESTLRGHFGMLSTYQRLMGYFFWSGMKKGAEAYMGEYDMCKRSKADQCKSPRFLEPLPIPS
ncbi:hypothetical protein ACH5RR_016113 [Cinchona calisaya]|uniref:Integrase zinc-binding domain-containing protein n=1 Tax=Cinchona calisaya TaxID=153742 RepID=A0ABD2ZVZ3_9GENT